MTDRRLLALAAAAISRWALWAGVGRATSEIVQFSFEAPIFYIDGIEPDGYEIRESTDGGVTWSAAVWVTFPESCPLCLQAEVIVDVPEPPGTGTVLVELRANRNGVDGPWIPVVEVPEPGVGVGLMVGVGYLCYWSRRVKGGPGTIPAPRTR